jgi:RNase adapter protein RapZ
LTVTAPPDKARLVLVTGLSGSGKSTVANCFEDLGYHCVDNLPLPLLRRFLADPVALAGGSGRIAVVTDVRAAGFAEEFPRLLRELDRTRLWATLLFLEASEEALVRRFSETRRRHPLAGDGPAIEGIRRERELLADLRGGADMVLDTSEWTAHEIRNHIYREFGAGAGEEPEMVISLVSFGFKFGVPHGADLVFDVRFLPNPHFVPGLRERTGREEPVQSFLDQAPGFTEFLERLAAFLLYLLPKYRQENRSYLSVAIGCTGGRHRSVAITERLAEHLKLARWPVRASHRDIGR